MSDYKIVRAEHPIAPRKDRSTGGHIDGGNGQSMCGLPITGDDPKVGVITCGLCSVRWRARVTKAP